MELLLLAGALLLAWLAKKAFQDRCEAVGVSEGHGAWVILKVLVISVVAGFILIMGLVMYLSSLNAGH